MIAALDVQYQKDNTARAACVLFSAFDSESSTLERVVNIDQVEAYVPGEFYKRELPCLLAILNKISEPLDCIIVDSYVDLAKGKGMGRWLFEALHEKIPVIGVAKKEFKSASAIEILRGDSEKPLYITAAGIDINTAAKAIQKMSGDFRIPTVLRLVDHLARGYR